MSMTGSGETMAMVSMEVQIAGAAIKYAGKFSMALLKLFKQIAIFFHDKKIVDMKGKNSMKSLLKHNPNLSFFKLPNDAFADFEKFCKKNNVPYAILGEKLSQKYGHPFQSIAIPEDKAGTVAEFFKLYNERHVKEDAGENKGTNYKVSLNDEKEKIHFCTIGELCSSLAGGRDMEQLTNDFQELFPNAEIERVKEGPSFRGLNKKVKQAAFEKMDKDKQEKFLKETKAIDKVTITFENKDLIDKHEVIDGVPHIGIRSSSENTVLYVPKKMVQYTKESKTYFVSLGKDSDVKIATFDGKSKTYTSIESKKCSDFITSRRKERLAKKEAKEAGKLNKLAEKKAKSISK